MIVANHIEYKRKVDFAEMINRIGLSFETKIGEIIVRGIEKTYNVLSSNFCVKGAYTDENLLAIAQRVQAKTGVAPVIYGTKMALANLRKENASAFSEKDKESISQIGHIGSFYGIDVVEIPQSVNADDAFMLSDAMLYVIPNGAKVVKLLFEGDADIIETADPATRKDMQLEYMFMRRIQIGVCKASVYGVYKIQE